ncbi:hypothetical protein PG993_014447 [Apiospora rasikravindrae]|uniref:SET domain-containing protein n=1 Tax=Apiospora rasikravindrae TaxID=990691 RepID=A0ABR1RMU5_9PEZI
MEPHEQLLQWAEAKGVKLDGIAPQRLPGRGMGIVATRPIQPDEILLEVPARCLRSIETVPKSLSRRLPRDISVHGLLAADLALDASDTYAAWNAVCPTPIDFASMPIHWPPGAAGAAPRPRACVVGAAKGQDRTGLGRRIQAVPFFLLLLLLLLLFSSVFFFVRCRRQWRRCRVVETKVRPRLAPRQYAHLLPREPRLRRRAKEDRMVLQPVADLFNHAGSRTGWCHVAFDAASFTVRADRPYSPGDEVRICYGRHGGDLLLVEYGFVLGGSDDDDDDDNNNNKEDWLEENCWDEVGLDDVLLPRLSDSAKDKLSEVGFLGGYVLDAGTVCYRTQVALRALCCLQTGREEEWRRFLEDGEDADAARQGEVDSVFVGMLEEYRAQTIGETLAKVAAKEDDDGSDSTEGRGGGGDGGPSSSKAQRELLCKRWRHVDRLVRITIERLKGEASVNKTH